MDLGSSVGFENFCYYKLLLCSGQTFQSAASIHTSPGANLAPAKEGTVRVAPVNKEQTKYQCTDFQATSFRNPKGTVWIEFTYSQVSNRRTGTLINFRRFFVPTRSIFKAIRLLKFCQANMIINFNLLSSQYDF